MEVRFMSEYPQWVKQFRIKGTAIKKVGNQYYIYKHTSKHVPGKKWPQAVDHYLGVVTPDGIVYKNKKKVSLENIDVYEYGFSSALIQLCPQSWKDDLGEDWYGVLMMIISCYSDNSYYLRDFNQFVNHHNIDYHHNKLISMIDINELLLLKHIYLLSLEDRNIISRINDDCKKIIDKYNIKIEGVSG